ncbi:hypothetical protein [Dactylosporangium sp. NPDC005555]|uniref:hypothetical protein n=1 Tax=Dactylosporangium sp. NPDC005555 TaxID=3154889 RepID=UPI0033ABB7B0
MSKAAPAKKAAARKAAPEAPAAASGVPAPVAAEPVTPAAVVSEGGLDAGTGGTVENAAAVPTGGAATEAIPGRENGNNVEEASSMTPEDWASLARP